MAEYDTLRGMRISGSGLASFTARNNNVATGQTVRGFFDPFTGTFLSYIPITPRNVDSRLNQVADTYQFYAFRKLTMTYIPTCGSTQQGSLAYGMSQDSDTPYNIPNPSQQNVLQFNHSAMAPTWQPTELTWNFKGTKCWDTNSTSAQIGDVTKYFQGVFVSAYDAPIQQGGTDRSETGKFYLTYVVDFYEPQPGLFSNLNVQLCPPCGVFADPCEEKRIEELVEAAMARRSHRSSRRSSRRSSLGDPIPLPLLSCHTEFPTLPEALMPVSPDLRCACPNE